MLEHVVIQNQHDKLDLIDLHYVCINGLLSLFYKQTNGSFIMIVECKYTLNQIACHRTG